MSYSPLMLPTAERCPRCLARVRWCYSPSGKRVMIDAEPSADGVLMLTLEERGWVAERRRDYRAIALRGEGAELYSYHHHPEP